MYTLAAGSFLNSPIGLILFICCDYRRFLVHFDASSEEGARREWAAMIADMEVGDTVLTTSGFLRSDHRHHRR